MTITWDPGRYLDLRRRARPPVRRAARRGSAPTDPATVVDLGCGPGQPDRRCSPSAGRPRRCTGARLQPGDDRGGPRAPSPASPSRSPTCATGPPRGEPVDVLVSNATLQWVPGHLDLLPALVARVAPGRLVRLPGAGQLRRAQPHDPRRAGRRGAVRRAHRRRRGARRATTRRLPRRAGRPRAATVDAWETTYLHVLTGEDPVFTWVTGTGARPTLQALPDELRPSFERGVPARGSAAAYPDTGHGVVLPFRRVFVVAPSAACDEAAPRPGGLPARRRGRGAPVLRRGPRADRGRQAAGAGGPRRLLVPGVRRPRRVTAEIHVGVEDPFAAGPQGTPGAAARRSPDSSRRGAPRGGSASRSTGPSGDTFPGHRRCHTRDAHGNRVELLA